MADIIYQNDDTGKYIAGMDPYTPENQDGATSISILKVRRKGRASAADWVLADIRGPLNEQEQIEFDKAVKECAESFFEQAPPELLALYRGRPEVSSEEWRKCYEGKIRTEYLGDIRRPFGVKDQIEDSAQEEDKELTLDRLKGIMDDLYAEIPIEPKTIPLPLTIQSL